MIIGAEEVVRLPKSTNLHATVYFPVNCKNKCPFCTSKALYTIYKPNKKKVMDQVKALAQSKILSVTITGGEPTSDLTLLGEMLDILADKDVYINTTALQDNIAGLTFVVNAHTCVKGVSVSRHSPRWSDDNKLLPGICQDDNLLSFNKAHLRINAVVDDSLRSPEMMKTLLRWEALKHSDMDVSFRLDYNRVSPYSLHLLDSPLIQTAQRCGKFIKQTDCAVCDNLWFETERGLQFRIHRGLAYTRLAFGLDLLVESIVVFPDGRIATDWDGSDDGLAVVAKAVNLPLIK